MIVGVDEAGRGPLAGIVSACALHLVVPPPFCVKDSKELSAAQREAVFPWLLEHSVLCLGIATPREIDEVNILNATMLAFDRAIEGIIKKVPALKSAQFIIDGNIFRTDRNIRYVCMEKADKKVKEVSCASIVAKVARDYLMHVADFLYPQWGFYRHKGYPTREHFSLIKKHPLTPLHRRSFFPCTMQGESS
ncbi:MAG: ribonuclease HII [Candidatus Omnitrophica bacterium]|nr:ribonuclease HII [Candidatus Omnitrophota bacterium]